MFINIYNTLITILYPLVIKRYIKKRLANGKEDASRFNERVGRPLSNVLTENWYGYTELLLENLFPCFLLFKK